MKIIISLIGSILLFSLTPYHATAQVSLSGSTKVAAGGTECYIAASNSTCPNLGGYCWSASLGTVSTNGDCDPGIDPEEISGVGSCRTQPAVSITFNNVTTLTNSTVTVTNSCGASTSIIVTVVPPLNTVVVSPSSQNVIAGSGYTTLTASTPSGGDGVYNYQWQQSADNIGWSNIQGATAGTYTPSGASAGTQYFRLIVTSFEYQFTSSPVAVNTYPAIQINPVSILYANGVATVTCNGVTGGNGTYAYQWQTSADNSTWSNAAGATALSYVSNPAVSTWYRLAVTSTGTTVYSNTVFQVVYPQVVPGTISPANITIFENASPGVLISTAATAGTGTYAYQWESSTDNNTWADIPGATSLSYAPPALTVTTYYRIRIPKVNTTGSVYTNTVKVAVKPFLVALTGGFVTPDYLTIVSGAAPGQLTASSASGGGCSGYTYQWQQSANGTGWTDISGANSQNYTPGALTSTTYFRRQVSCGNDKSYTNICTIQVETFITCVDMNFVRERVFVQAGITDKTAADAVADVKSVRQSTQYVDGLGRLSQKVNKQASPALKDVVQPVVYDAFGREVIKYLPYVAEAADGNYRCNPIPEQESFNSVQFPQEQYYYGQIDLEASPLNRVHKTYAAGNSWVGSGRGISNEYGSNTNSDVVRIWNITDVAGSFGSYSTKAGAEGIYLPGTLYKTTTADEKGNQVIEFKNKDGLVILKKVQLTAAADNGAGSNHPGWLCTYYIYDDLNRLRCVVQPKGVELLINNNWDFTALNQNILNEQCFRYEYDTRNRMTMKKLPGAGVVNLIYDVRDRLVFTQDGNMRSNGNNQWLGTLYDPFNRPVITGLMTWAGSAAALQDAVNQKTIISGETIVEGINVSRSPIPDNATFDVLTKTGYDVYTTIPSASGLDQNIDNTYTSSTYVNTNYNSFPFAEPVIQSMQTIGLLTWTQTKVLGTTSQYLYTVPIYDAKGRTIQVKSKNSTNGTDIVTTQYTFSGQPLVVVQKQEKIGSSNPQTHTLVTRNTYNDLGLLTNITKKISSVINGVVVDKPEIETVVNDYDVLGRLKTKSIGKKKDANGNYTADALQKLNYDYNIRGWLLGMNRNYLTTEGQTSDGTMFGYELGYDKTANKADRSFAKGEYNGNISGMLWKSDGDDIRRKYDFTYDGTNRLLLADFEQQNRDDHQWNKSQVNCDVKIGDDSKDPTKAYDANGNILWMQQWGLNVTHSEQIDDLHYSYFNGETSNKLRTVTDNAVGGTLPTATDAGLGDFSDKSSSGNDYGYDANGNMVVDLNKRIKNSTLTPGLDMTNGAIVYNHLNLPATMTVKDANDVDKGTIRYVYDATGNKLQKIVLEKNASGDITTTTTYLDGAVYESKEYANNSLASMNYTDKLLFLGQEEGRVRYIPEENGVAAHYEYDYFIKDHLNNVRMVLTEQSNDHKYMATMEHGANNVVRDQEKQLFDNLDASELLAASVPNGGYPTGNSATNPNEYVARVNGIDHKQGPGIVLKVMSGDVVNIGVQSYYRSKNITPQNGNVLNDILSSLAGGIVAASGVVKGTIGDLSNPSSSPLLGALNTFRNNYNHDMPGKPKAYLNWVLLDEQFKYVDAWPQSGVKPVEGADAVHPLSSGEIDIAKNGYLYIYVSNETENWDVYFDDLAVMHHTGPLLEETHYYPFGLTMAGISSKALTGAVENKCKFNEIEQSTDLGLNQYDAFYRNLDPQIGRFWQIDPKAIDEISPYASMLNNPITHCDPLGDTTTYYDEEGNVLYSTNLKGYRNAFIVNNNSLDAAKQFFGQLGENIGSIGEFLVDAAFSVGNRNGELGDAYDLQSISKFYEQNEAQGEIKSIDRYPIEKMNSITVDGKTVTKEYAKSLKGAEYWANMKKVNGVWTVDFNTVGTVGDMTRSNVSGNDPYIHIHNYTPQLLGKTLRYTVPAAHGFAPGAVGPMVNSLIPSYLDGDVGKAKSEGKIGTVRNMVVNYSHIWFYNGEGIGFKVNRK